MSTLAELVVKAPVMAHGVPSGVGAWNVAVEMAMPSAATSVLGLMKLGNKLSSKGWYDVTELVQGIQISRGGSAGDRPVPGTLTVQLDNEDTSLSPWTSDDYFLSTANSYLGPGTLVRVVAFDTTPPAGISALAMSDLTLTGAAITVASDIYKFPVTYGNSPTASKGTYNISGKSVQLETIRFPTDTYINNGCFLSLNGSAGSYLQFRRWGNGISYAMCFNFATGVTSTAIFNQATRWQIREASGTTYFETSVDGANWITRLSATTPADMTATTVNVYTNPLFAGHNVTAAAGWWVSDLNTTQLADSWQPLSTGIVESWEEVTTALGSMSSVLVTCTDTMSVLAQVDTNAVTPVGAGETPSVRIQRLADAASWKFGTYLAYSGPARTMQATDLSMNRIGEMYLVADSVDELLFSGRDGRIWFGQKDSRYVDSPLLPIQVLHGGRLFFTSNPRIHLGSAAHAAQPNWVPASIDDFRTKNNDDLIIGTVTLARAGGSAVTTSDTTVNGRYQLRTYTRSDLVTQDPGSNADLTYVAGRILDRSDETYRPDAVVLDGKMSDKCAQFIFTMDVGLMVPIYTDHVSFIDVTICAYTIRILPLNEDELDISATINFEPNTVSSWARV